MRSFKTHLRRGRERETETKGVREKEKKSEKERGKGEEGGHCGSSRLCRCSSAKRDEGARGVDAEGEEAEGDRSVFSVDPATNRTLVYAALAVSYHTYVHT